MGTPAQNEANRNNSTLSTGPRTSAGKRKASQNAYKHGLRTSRDQVLREESLAFEARMHRWSAPGGEDDVKEFLIQDNVSLSFEIERVKRSHFERLRQHIENADDAELEAVRDLGSRLYFDCTGPTSTYGTRKWDSKKDRASWQKEAVQPDDPGELVKKLLSSAHGCYWLLEQWDFLKDRLHTGRGHWVPSDKFRAIRLISKQPIDAVDCKTVAQIFTASHALYQAGKPFDNLISDMGEAALDTYVKRVTSLYRDLIGAEDPKKARQFLIELVEENIREIEVVLEEHLEKDREKAQRTIDHHGFNDTREGEAIRRHWLRCRNALVRGAKINERRQGGGKNSREGGLRSGRAELGSGDGGADGTRRVPATGSGREDSSGSDVLAGRGDAAFAERKTAIWELAERASIKLGAYVPPLRHGIVAFCLLLD